MFNQYFKWHYINTTEGLQCFVIQHKKAIIKRFEKFHSEQKAHKINTIEKAYEILGASKDDSNDELKSKYRKLVRIHHPDIVTGKGGDEKSIAEATQKLQEINEAYEIIKKDRGI